MKYIHHHCPDCGLKVKFTVVCGDDEMYWCDDCQEEYTEDQCEEAEERRWLEARERKAVNNLVTALIDIGSTKI
jgi:predicted RNA-binding Zn-ribbon protein involved in translation (DUF1610 family)